MARIPDHELDRIKRDTDLVALVEASGVKLARQGQDWVGLCVFHSDTQPSLVVSVHKVPPVWRCFGCGAGGSCVDFVMKRDGVDFRTAVATLAPGLVMDGGEAAPTAGEVAEPPVLVVTMDDRAIGEAVALHYHATLLESPGALAYLERRGLALPAMLGHFRIGYADGSLPKRIAPKRHSKPGQAFRRRLAKLGWMREASGKEHMHGRITVPVVDETGAVVQMYGRLAGSSEGTATPKHLYMPSPLSAVFNWQALVEHQEVILCEAIFDALTFWAAGFRNVITAYGKGGFLPVHWEVLRRFGTRRVLIAYDRDDQAEKAAATLGGELMAEGIECFRVLFPRGMDANAYACRVKPAEKSLGLAIRQAQWMGKGRPPAHGSVLVAAAGDGEPSSSSLTGDSEAVAPAQLEVLCTDVEVSISTTPPTLADVAAAAAAEAVLASSLAARLAAGATAPAASPAPEPPAVEVPCEVNGDELVLWLADRRYRVRGLAKNLTPDVLKVNLMASRGDALHVDTLDLYSARQRGPFCKLAATELDLDEDIVRHDLRRVLLRLELFQREAIDKALKPEPTAPVMTAEEREQALALAKDPDLLSRILGDFDRCGVVGEETNKLVGYLAATSRKLEAPLAVLIQSSSAAGKTALMEAVLAMMPEEERIKYSAMTGQSLFYMSEQDLKHKILALVEEEGAERASYALKLLQSEGELTIASTGKDPQSGRLVTHEYRVEGPVAILLTTTAATIDEELLNRALVLSVDEDRAQTRAIHRLQRERRTLDGYARRRQRVEILTLHQNLQRLLEPLPVINPYAPALAFLDTQTRTRRDHEKYLTLIDAIALLHQHQRPRRQGRTAYEPAVYIEVAPEDVALANQLAHEVLGRTLDELPPQTRRLLGLLDRMVAAITAEQEIPREDVRFGLRQAREATGWGQTQLRLHLSRLVDLEYAVTHRGGRGQTFVYELVYDGKGKNGRPFLPKLIDVEPLIGAETGTVTSDLSGFRGDLSGQTLENAGSKRPRNGVKTGGSRGRRNGVEANVSRLHLSGNGNSAENAYVGVEPSKPPSTVAAR